MPAPRRAEQEWLLARTATGLVARSAGRIRTRRRSCQAFGTLPLTPPPRLRLRFVAIRGDQRSAGYMSLTRRPSFLFATNVGEPSARPRPST